MKYLKYDKYQKTSLDWLPEIPHEWNLRRLKNHYYILNGATPKSSGKSYWNGDIFWATPSDVSKVSKQLCDTARKITQEGLDSCG
ncbi:MAG: hypothetical protein K8S87_10075, partial [Planctomycetes bacterium]|nr:hypothetical protein [Planctomycetota bacterium]